MKQKKIVGEKREKPFVWGYWLAGLLIIWFAFVAYHTYNFSDASAWKTIEYNTAYLPDVVSKIPRGIHLFFFILYFLFCSVGCGYLLLKPFKIEWRDAIEQIFFSIMFGLIFIAFCTLALGVFGLLQTTILFSFLLVCCCVSLFYCFILYSQHRKRSSTAVHKFKTRSSFSWQPIFLIGLSVVLALFLYSALLGGLTPFIGYDGGWYYSGSAKHYAQRETIFNVVEETRMGVANLSFYQQLHYTMLIKLFGLITAKLLNWLYLFLTALFIIYFCRVHFQSALMGLMASVLFTSLPIVNWSTNQIYIDLPMAFYLLLAIHAFLRWREQPKQVAWLALVGVAIGYSIVIKSFGLFTLFLLAPAVLFYTYWYPRPWPNLWGSFSRLLALGSGVIVCCLPWFWWNFVTTRNPVFPYANTIFKSPYWNRFGDDVPMVVWQKLELGLDNSLWGFISMPWESVTAGAKYQTLSTPLFLIFLPFCLMLWFFTKQSSRWLYQLLAGYLFLWLMLWFFSGAIEIRYAMGILPIACILVAYVLIKQDWQGRAGKYLRLSGLIITGVIILIGSQLLLPLHKAAQNPVAVGQVSLNWEFLYRNAFSQLTHEQVMLNYCEMCQFINQNLTPGKDKIYDGLGTISSVYTNINVEIFNGFKYDGPGGLGQWDIYSSDALSRLQQIGVTYVGIHTNQIAILKFSPIWNYLEEVYRFDGWNVVIYRLKYQ